MSSWSNKSVVGAEVLVAPEVAIREPDGPDWQRLRPVHRTNTASQDEPARSPRIEDIPEPLEVPMTQVSPGDAREMRSLVDWDPSAATLEAADGGKGGWA